MIFLHRQNDPANIQFKNVDGLELDIRSCAANNGSTLILTHDRLRDFQFERSEDLICLDDVIQDLKPYTVIVNVKESGLEEEVSEILEDNNINYYFLDSQIPDIIRLCRQEKFKGKFIIRVSDFEEVSDSFIEHTMPEYIWVDYSKFSEDNFKIHEYKDFLENILKIQSINTCKKILVSPELYGLQNIKITNDIINSETVKNILKEFCVCTKIPDDWREIV